MKRMLAAVIIVTLFASSAILAAEKRADKKADKKTDKKVEQKVEKQAGNKTEKPVEKTAGKPAPKKIEKKPEPREVRVEKSESDQSSKWSISAGVRSREMDVDFSAEAPSEYANWRSLVRRPRNSGSTAFYNEELRLEYEDGAISADPVWTGVDGTANFGVERADQIGRRSPLFYTATFGSTRTRQWSELTQTDLNADDDTSNGGVYVAARRALADNGVGLLVQYGVNAMDTGSGWQEAARQSIMERRVNYETTYDIDPSSIPLPTAPFESDKVWLVYDANDWNTRWSLLWGDTAMAPRQSRAASRRTLAVLTASTKCDLDADIHDLLLGLELGLPLGEWLSLSLALGPTLNIIAWDLERTTQWANEATGAILQTTRENESDEEVEVGAAAQVTARLNLDKDKRFFCEGSVAYNWLDQVEVKSDTAAAEIDASSVSAALGFGVGF